MTAYLRPTAPIAPEVVIVADPGLAMTLARRVLEKPVMANHHHGLWGYSGRTEAGRELTVQATGIGAPSAAAVLGELAEHGARRLIRLGRCTALAGGPERSEALVVSGALGGDGVSRALGSERSAPDPILTQALRAELGNRQVLVASFDLPAAQAAQETKATWADAQAAVADLDTAALLALGQRLEIAVAAVLVVAEPAAERDGEAVETALSALGPVLVTALETAAAGAAAGPAGS